MNKGDAIVTLKWHDGVIMYPVMKMFNLACSRFYLDFQEVAFISGKSLYYQYIAIEVLNIDRL